MTDIRNDTFAELQRLRDENQRLQTELASRDNDITSLQMQREQLREQLANKDMTLGAYIQREQDTVLKLGAVTAELDSLVKDCNDLSEERSVFRNRIHEFESALSDVRKERPEVEELQSIVPTWDENKGNLVAEELLSYITDLQRTEASWRNAHGQWQVEVDRYKARVEQLEQAVQKMMARLADLLDEDQFADMEDIARGAKVSPPTADPRDEQVILATEALCWVLGQGVVMAIHHIGGKLHPRLVNNGDYDSMTPPEHLSAVLDAAVGACRAALAHPQSCAAEQRYECHGLDTPTLVRFYEHDFYPLSNFSSFCVRWRGHSFFTTEHAYHWARFDLPNGVGQLLQSCVQRAASAHEAFKFAQAEKRKQRPDWDEVKVDTMREILRAKAQQHEYVRRKLLATGDRELAEDSWRDDFWGWGPNRDGQNMLGKLWMEIRAELNTALAQPQAEQKSVSCPSDECPMCNSECCNKCGAGCWAPIGSVKCDHDVLERHEANHQEQQP